MLKRLTPTRTVAPAANLLSVADAKAALRIDHSDDDALLGAYISAVEAYLDGYTGVLGRALVTQTWAESFSHFEYRMPLRLRPVQSIASIQYYDNDEAQQTLASGVYRLHEDAGGAYLVQRDGESWPSTFVRDDAVTITYVAGYGAAAAVPAPIVQAAKMMIGSWYAHREAVQPKQLMPVPFGVQALIDSYRAQWARSA